jgi:hypothetical protein
VRHRFEIRWATILVALVSLVALWALPGAAQVDANEVPLGDLARNLRKKPAPAQNVIDDDNLSNALSQIESKRAAGGSLKYVMSGGNTNFEVSAPDVTCSLAFNANAKALLSSQYAQMDLPSSDLTKLQGPATIEGDALTVSVFNGSDWHVSEIAVAFTVVRKNSPAPPVLPYEALSPGTNPVPAASDMAADAVRPERKPDHTVIYHMRAAASPLSRAVFSAPLNLDLALGDEWHWAIVQAKGYPPQGWRDAHPIEQVQTPVSLPADDSVANPNPLPPTAQQLSTSPASYSPPQ